MIKKILALSAVLTFLSTPLAQAKHGVGIILGDPSGLSFQTDTKANQKVNGGFAYSFDSWIQIWGDYAFYFPTALSSLFKKNIPVSTYLGGGLGVVIGTDKNKSSGLLVRVPFGVEHTLSSQPIEFFAEVVPALVMSSNTGSDFQAGIGARFLF